MLPLLAKVNLGQNPLSPQLTGIEIIEPEAPPHQNKIPLPRGLIPLARGQIPPDLDPILDPQGVDLHLNQEEINIGPNLPKVIQRNGDENFINCNFHLNHQMMKKPGIGKS